MRELVLHLHFVVASIVDIVVRFSIELRNQPDIAVAAPPYEPRRHQDNPRPNPRRRRRYARGGRPQF